MTGHLAVPGVDTPTKSGGSSYTLVNTPSPASREVFQHDDPAETDPRYQVLIHTLPANMAMSDLFTSWKHWTTNWRQRIESKKVLRGYLQQLQRCDPIKETSP